MRIFFPAAVLLGFCLVSCSAEPEKEPMWKEVSGEKALAHVQALVDLGPRIPGSEALERSRAYIEKNLRDVGWEVTRQPFSDETPRGKMEFVNLIARFRGKNGNVKSTPDFLICSHYDTKIFDNAPFVGANDGGSSSGL
ncbi:MAG TPA: hypothetical protein VJ719_14095, partial [Chthoniobacterales bacterium]|nr:hypothetical protein [Chthoniobacterales bacterium]